MNAAQLTEIEAGLGIKLPVAYRQFALAMPAPLAGNSNSRLWDDARALIALNFELRKTHEWTPRHFAVGRDATGSTGAIDLDLALVLWADHCRLPKPGDDAYQPRSILEFVEQCMRDLDEARVGTAKVHDPLVATYAAPRSFSSELVATVAVAVGLLGGILFFIRSCG